MTQQLNVGTNLREALVKAAGLKPIGKVDPGLAARRAHHDLIRENANRVIRRQVRQENEKNRAQAAAKSTSTTKKTPSKTTKKAK